MGAVIAAVYPDSIASRLGLTPGDEILTVNGVSPLDLIQFQWAWAEEEVRIEVKTKHGKKCYTVLKAYDEGPGVQFIQPVFDGIRTCANRCLFCFVDQMAPGCRESLYIKDDDFRLSFLQGSYITLTNLKPEDLRRIEEERLTPLYVSVHATDPVARSTLLGREKPDRFAEIMTRLDHAGICFHCQVVLCPGYNDDEILYKTVDDLSRIGGVLSVSVVPVGLTRYRQGLTALRQVGQKEAAALIEWLGDTQTRYQSEKGSRFVWLSDEFYVLAGQDMPEDASYEDYCQWENGVGMVRSFLEEADSYPLPVSLPEEKELILAGAAAPMKALAPLWERLERVKGLSLKCITLENRFFGSSVTVSGLLTGKCLMEGLGAQKLSPGAVVHLSEAMLKDDSFIDGFTVDEVSRTLGLRLEFLPLDGNAALTKLMEA